jgi:hypothetical protein
MYLETFFAPLRAYPLMHLAAHPETRQELQERESIICLCHRDASLFRYRCRQCTIVHLQLSKGNILHIRAYQELLAR